MCLRAPIHYKALDLGSSSKERAFKSRSRQYNLLDGFAADTTTFCDALRRCASRYTHESVTRTRTRSPLWARALRARANKPITPLRTSCGRGTHTGIGAPHGVHF